MKKILVLVFSIVFLQTKTQAQQLARIANGDSYLNIRTRESSDSKIIGSFQASEFFYVQPDSTNWWKAKSINGKEGFVYRGRVQLIDSLPEAQLRNLFSNVFENEKELAENYANTFLKYNFETRRWSSRPDSIISLKAQKVLAKYSREKYSPMLEIFGDYFCHTSDTPTLKILFSIFEVDKLSSSQSPGWCLATCYICSPEIISNFIAQLPPPQKEIIKSDMEERLKQQ